MPEKIVPLGETTWLERVTMLLHLRRSQPRRRQVEPSNEAPKAIPPAPRRRFELMIKVGADDWARALNELENLVRHIDEHGVNCNSVSGGYDTHHIVEIVETADMTHDRYVQELTVHLEALHARDRQNLPSVAEVQRARTA